MFLKTEVNDLAGVLNALQEIWDASSANAEQATAMELELYRAALHLICAKAGPGSDASLLAAFAVSAEDIEFSRGIP